MTFQYASDLHLEFPENYDYLNKFPIQPKAGVLILAGDIVTFSQLENRMDFFNYVSDNFEHVYWIRVIMNIIIVISPDVLGPI